MINEKIKGATYTRRYIYDFHYDLIWVTKQRRPIFTTEQLQVDMARTLTMIAHDNKIKIEQLEVKPDHVHVLISFSPSKAPASAIKAFKGRSAYLFLKQHPELSQDKNWAGHLWSPSYYMRTLGEKEPKVLETYLNDPKYHDPK